MRMRSHYPDLGARLLLAATFLLYGWTLSASPVLHMMEDAGALGVHATAEASEPGLGSAPAEHSPERTEHEGPLGEIDLDCLLCQVLTGSAHPTLPTASAAPALASLAVGPMGEARPGAHYSPTAPARAPPFG